MRRRDFIKAIVGSAPVWPLAAHGQQTAKSHPRFALVNPSVSIADMSEKVEAIQATPRFSKSCATLVTSRE